MTNLDLPPHLVSEVQNGNIVLVLGAGASLEAKNAEGKTPPTAKQLAKMLAEQFLQEKHESLPLAQVAEYAIHSSDLFTVQRFIAESLAGFHETPAHLMLPTFRWRAIATTNYDTLIEQAFRATKAPAQTIVPFIDNTDATDERMDGRNTVMLLKLHGCISRPSNPNCPFILTTDQFISYGVGRTRLFNTLKELASQRSLLFVGYALQDTNLRQMLLELDKEVPSRPRFFMVSPEIEDFEINYWSSKKITAINGTFESLLRALNERTNSTFRGLPRNDAADSHPIVSRFSRPNIKLTTHTEHFLESDVDYVNALRPATTLAPHLFYKGVTHEWDAIAQELDVPRPLADTILLDHFLEGAADGKMKLIVVTGHAGSGKSILLQRLAWEAAHTYDKLCVFVRPDGVLNSGCLSELQEATGDRIFLFVDNIIERRREIERVFTSASKLPITVVSTARTNEWNQAPESLTALATEECELPYLTKKEIENLLSLLEKHDALGTLGSMGKTERMAQLMERSGRQLLVALHEATLGRRFEDIISDEYEMVRPQRAKSIYLTVCLLNQFGAPVRAGLIARRYGVTFEEFEKEFFSPLEQLVITDYDRRSGDNVYSARHPHVAEIVVKAALQSQEDLLAETLNTIRYLNPIFASDQGVLRRMLQGRALLEQFGDHSMVEQIYDAAREVAGDDAFLFQQMAIYEMNRAGGDLKRAEELLATAAGMAPHTRSIRHTTAELKVRQAEASALRLERQRHLLDATKLCRELKSQSDGAYPYYTLVKIGTLKLKTLLEEDDPQDSQIEMQLRSTQEELSSAIQLFPDNSQLRKAEAELADVLSQSERAIKALQKAFDLNPKSAFIGQRLASHYAGSGDVDKALDVLRRALEAKSRDKKLHFAYGQMLLAGGRGTGDEILYHLERAYSEGDQNYEAQFLHARQLFAMGQCSASKDIFVRLRNARTSYSARHTIRYEMPEPLYGYIQRIEGSYFVIRRESDNEWIYARRDECDTELWSELSIGMRVVFRIGFTFRGACAFAVAKA